MSAAVKWTAEEDATIVAMRADGCSFVAIGKRLGKNHQAVAKRKKAMDDGKVVRQTVARRYGSCITARQIWTLVKEGHNTLEKLRVAVSKVISEHGMSPVSKQVMQDWIDFAESDRAIKREHDDSVAARMRNKSRILIATDSPPDSYGNGKYHVAECVDILNVFGMMARPEPPIGAGRVNLLQP